MEKEYIQEMCINNYFSCKCWHMVNSEPLQCFERILQFKVTVRSLLFVRLDAYSSNSAFRMIHFELNF